jgi:hypothetical protein
MPELFIPVTFIPAKPYPEFNPTSVFLVPVSKCKRNYRYRERMYQGIIRSGQNKSTNGIGTGIILPHLCL